MIGVMLILAIVCGNVLPQSTANRNLDFTGVNHANTFINYKASSNTNSVFRVQWQNDYYHGL